MGSDMLLIDLIVGAGLIGAFYFEYEYFAWRTDQEKKETDRVQKFNNFAVRIKSITLIITAIVYFFIRLKNVW